MNDVDFFPVNNLRNFKYGSHIKLVSSRKVRKGDFLAAQGFKQIKLFLEGEEMDIESVFVKAIDEVNNLAFGTADLQRRDDE